MAVHTEKQLEELLRFEAFLAELSLRFVNLPANEVDGTIEDCQRLFCEALGLDRSTLFQSFPAMPGRLLLTHLYESKQKPMAAKVVEKRAEARLHSNVYWITPGEEEGGSKAQVDVKMLWPWVYEQLQRGEPVIIFDPNDLPQEAARDREMLQQYGTKSTVVVPLSTGGTQFGCLTFATTRETRRWSELELKRFRFIADLFASVLARKRGEEALQDSERRFRQVAEIVADFIWEVDADGLYTYASPSVEKILGYSPPELVGKMHFYDLFVPAIREESKAAAFQLFAARRPVRAFLNANVAKDGKIVYLETSGLPVLDKAGNLSGYRGSDTDVTERRRVHEELRQSERKFRTLHESMRDAFVSVDMSGRILEFNSAYHQMLGYSESELRGVRLTDITPESWHSFEAKLVQEQVLVRGYSDVYEKQYRKKDGTVFPVELRIFLIRDDAHRPAAMWAIVRDITDRKRAEQELQERGEQIRMAVEATGFGAYAYDFKIRQGSYSGECLALFGVPPERALELDEELIPTTVHPDDRPAFLAHLKAARDPCGAGLFDLEFRVKPSGQDGCRWLRMRGRTLFTSGGPEGEPERWNGIVQDITERKLAEEALRKSYAEIKQLKDRLQAESDYLKAEIKLNKAHGQIIGHSQGIKKVLRAVEQVAPADCAVLVSGETGTGKELIAQEIHRLSRRKDRVMMLVNCAALPSALVESELFGRERGAYTGALTSQVGRFEIADGSTIFLDEVGELSTEVQAKLLRVLQQGEFERLGSPKTHKVNVRVIAATNRDLAENVRKGRFREDLYYRLRVFPISIPPLRERTDDIPLLVFAFMEEFSSRMGKKITKIPRKAMEVLQGHSWPGNIRELRNVIEHSVILTTGDTLKLTGLGDAPTREAQPVTLAEAEREHILKTLENTRWRIKGPRGAAAKLDLQPSTLYSRMQKLGIPHRRLKDQMESEM